MGAVMAIDGSGPLRWKDGTIIDSELFANDPLDESLGEIQTMSEEKFRRLMEEAGLPVVPKHKARPE